MQDLGDVRIGVIGLGYVGLPVAVAFSNHFPVIGFDISPARIEELKDGRDHTREVPVEAIQQARQLTFTDDPANLKYCNVFIVTVPTPIDVARAPDFGPLEAASKTVGSVMSRGAVVIFESTVYPGATEEICVPLLERHSSLQFNDGFTVGYSPERINPGDHTRPLHSIKKVTSGSTMAAADFVDTLYRTIILAGTHRASSIKVAEAAKVIENTQRDLNIALMNELALICARLGIDTLEVLDTASSKWNFMPYRPGLVGGHCIGVDPYYLTYKAQQVGYYPEVILAGRRINDSMGEHIAGEVIKLMTMRKLTVVDSRMLVLGLTFKEGLPDIRNSKVVDIVRVLRNYGARVDVHDPWADPVAADAEYGIPVLSRTPQPANYDAIVVAVAHPEFVALGASGIHAFGKPAHVLYDVKGILPRGESDGRL